MSIADGETLFKLYAERIAKAQNDWGGNINSVTTAQGKPGDFELVEWKVLSLNARAFWADLELQLLEHLS